MKVRYEIMFELPIFNCFMCLKPSETPLARLCDACFERGAKSSPPRQSGRSLRHIRYLFQDLNAVFIVHNSYAVMHWQGIYPQLRNRIHSMLNRKLEYELRACNGKNIRIDHACWEVGDFPDWLYDGLMQIGWTPEGNATTGDTTGDTK